MFVGLSSVSAVRWGCSLRIHRVWLLLILCLGVVRSSLPAHAQQAGSVDASFDPGYGVDGTVNALAVQANGQVLVAGRFNHVNGAAYDNLARLHVDGTLDASFTPPAIAGAYSFVTVEVLALALQPDGRLLVGGTFTRIAGQSQNYLVRLNTDGRVDPSFVPVINLQSGTFRVSAAGVYAIALQPDGKIVAAGSFDLVDGRLHRGVVRLNADGSLDATFDPAVPAHVYPAQGLDNDASILALGPEGEVYVAGPFQTINGVSQPALARLHGNDGSLDTSFTPAGSQSSLRVVTALTCQPDGRLLAAGSFVQPGDKTSSFRSDLARFNVDGAGDVAFSQRHGNDYSSSSRIEAIVVQPLDGSILIAGSHLYLNGRAVGAIGRYLADGRVDKSFYPGLDPLAVNGATASASTVAVGADGRLLIGGDFDTVDGQFRHHLAGLLGSPSADCPVVNVRAQTALVIAANGSGSGEQGGKLVAAVKAPLTSALSVNYSASGKGTSWVASGTFSPGALPLPAGARKAKLRVPPSPFAIYGIGSGKNLKFQLEAGRGYVVGSSDTAKLRIVAAD